MPAILVVEDDPHIHLLVQVLLQQMGCEVVTVSRQQVWSGSLPVSYKTIGMIIDPYSGGENCFEVIRQFRGLQPQLPVIVMSATLDADDAFEVGATAFLPKPFCASDFLSLATHVFCAPSVRR